MNRSLLCRLQSASARNVLCLALLIQAASAATLTVSNTNDSGAGSLRQALGAAAGNGDAIVFAAGVTGTITLTSGELVVNKSVSITGPGAAHLTISGNNASRVMQVGSATVTLSGLRIANGRITGAPNTNLGGGGIYNNNGKLTLQNCEIADNVQMGAGIGGQGGGIWHVTAGSASSAGWLLLQNCLFSGNRAVGGSGADGAAPNGSGGDAGPGQGGAIFIWPLSVNSVTLKDCTFRDNLAIGGTGGNGAGTGARGRGGCGQGGAVYTGNFSSLVAERCLFRRNEASGGNRGAGGNAATTNRADGQGGALFISGYTAITDCTFNQNTAAGGPGTEGTVLIGASGQGGGLYFALGIANVSRSTFFDNVAKGGGGGSGGATNYAEGGAIYNRYDSGQWKLNVTNSTIVSNSARGGNVSAVASGGGIWTEGTLNLTNSTIVFNYVETGASHHGSGLRVTGGAATLHNTLVARNTAVSGAPEASGPIAPSSSHNLISIGAGAGPGVTGISHSTNNNHIGMSSAPLDPGVHAPAYNGGLTMTCSLDADSPGVNAGDGAAAPVVDQRGFGRSGVSDIGSFEFGGLPASLEVLSITHSGNGPMVLEFLGVPNGLHRIQASPDLSAGSFFDLATSTANAAGLVHYEDAAAGLTRRFYRAVFP